VMAAPAPAPVPVPAPTFGSEWLALTRAHVRADPAGAAPPDRAAPPHQRRNAH
jgi:hypothetical protein